MTLHLRMGEGRPEIRRVETDISRWKRLDLYREDRLKT